MPTSLHLVERFKEARKASGLTQEQAAQALGMSLSSVTRKERGEQPVTMRDVNAMERLAEQEAGIGIVPHATHGPAQGATLSSPARDRRIKEFEREAARLGALDAELDHIVESLSSGTSKAFYLGEGGEEELEYQIDGLRVWLERRIAKRKRAKRQGA